MNTKKAGLIRGNPLCGLCYRECIEVTKIFDGCVSRIADRQFTINLGAIAGTPPFTFVRVRSSGATVVSNLVITPQVTDKSRVEYDATVPITVFYTDSLGVDYQAQSSLSFHRQIYLSFPDPSMVSATVTVATSIVSTVGSFTGTNEVTFRCCTLQISKVSATVDLLVPSYGYCEFPDCNEEETCEAFFNLPLFPLPA